MSNIAQRHGLTEKQAAFVKAFVSGVPRQAAAEQAGYASDLSGYHLLSLPHVLAAVHQEMQRALIAEAPTSLRVLREIRDDKTAPARVRADIGIKILALAGHSAPERGESSLQKPLADMTRSELDTQLQANLAEIDRLEAELAARAKDVSAPASAPGDTNSEAKPLTYLD